MNNFVIVNCKLDNNFKKENFDYIIAIEKGYKYLKDINIVPDVVIGDFDSYPIENVKHKNIIKLDSSKDVSDLEYAIKHAIKINPDAHIICYQEEGIRHSHYLTQIQFVINYQVEMIFPTSKVVKLKRNNVIEKENYKYFSIFIIDTNNIIMENAKYEFKGEISFANNSLFLSNEWVSKKPVTIYFPNSPHAVLILENKD